MTGRTIVRFVEKIPTLVRQITAKIPVLRQSEVPQEPVKTRKGQALQHPSLFQRVFAYGSTQPQIRADYYRCSSGPGFPLCGFQHRLEFFNDLWCRRLFVPDHQQHKIIGQNLIRMNNVIRIVADLSEVGGHLIRIE